MPKRFQIGEMVKYYGGQGKITHIRHSDVPITYKINGKYVNQTSIRKLKQRSVLDDYGLRI